MRSSAIERGEMVKLQFWRALSLAVGLQSLEWNSYLFLPWLQVSRSRKIGLDTPGTLSPFTGRRLLRRRRLGNFRGQCRRALRTSERVQHEEAPIPKSAGRRLALILPRLSVANPL